MSLAPSLTKTIAVAGPSEITSTCLGFLKKRRTPTFKNITIFFLTLMRDFYHGNGAKRSKMVQALSFEHTLYVHEWIRSAGTAYPVSETSGSFLTGLCKRILKQINRK